MRNDPLKQYAKLRRQLLEEKASLEGRLNEINEVLGTELAIAPTPTETASEPSPQSRPRRGRGGNKASLRAVIAQALQKGPLSRKELGQAVQELGYVSKAKDPLASMGVILYAKNSPFKKKGGKFYLPRAGAEETPDHNSNGKPRGKRRRAMSPETKAKLSEAQRARWARQRAGG
jgi:hypothetical protein